MDIKAGDEIYVDEGDSIGCAEFSGIVASVDGELITMEDGYSFYHSDVMDCCKI